jgi:hypothetical protein
MGTTNRIINMAAGTSANDAVNYSQVMLRNGVNSATANIPLGGFKLTGVGLAVDPNDATSKTFVDDANTAQTTAITTAYTSADTAQTTAITTAYTAADALKLNLSGGNMTGAITSSLVQPLNFTNSTGPVICRLSAGNTTVTQLASIQMCSNSAGIIDFQDNLNLTKAKIQYTYGTPGAISLIVGGAQVLSASDTTLTCGMINMQNNRIFGLAATPTTDQDAVPRLFMQNAIATETTARIAGDASGTAALTAEVNSRVASVAAEATTRASEDALRLKLDGTSTMSGPLNLGSQRLTNLATSTTGSDACRSDEVLLLNGTRQMAGSINAGGFKVANAAYGSAGSADLCTVAQMEAGLGLCLKLNGSNTMTATLPVGSHLISGVLEPTLPDHASNKSYTDAADGLRMRINGSTPMTGALDMSSNKVISVGTPTANFDAVTKLYTDTKAYLRTSATSNGTFTVSDPLSTKTVMALRNISASGETYLQMEGATNLITAASATTGIVTSGFALSPTAFQYFTGTTPVGNARFAYDAGEFSINGNLSVSGGVILRDTWQAGETVQSVRKSPAFSQSLDNESCTVAEGNVSLINTSMTVTSGNHIVVRCTFQVSAEGSGNDHFRIVFEYGSTPSTVTFDYYLGSPASNRPRICTQEYCFLAPNSGAKTILVRLYNDSNDTLSILDTNWSFYVKEIKA